jgi:translation elongation factor EF-Tu-like GTPase
VAEGTFEMAVVDVFTIIDRGVVVVGPFKGDLPSRGDPLELVEDGQVVKAVTCQGVEWSVMVEEDRRYGVLLGGVERDEVRSGQVLAAAT